MNAQIHASETVRRYCPQPASKRRVIHFLPPTLQKSSSIIFRGKFLTHCFSWQRHYFECVSWKSRLREQLAAPFDLCILLLTSYENLFIKENFLCGVAFPALGLFIERETFDCQRRLYFMSNDVSLPIFIKKL